MLAKYGVSNGEAYVWLRVYKQKRIYGEMVCMGGTVRLKCRDCLRWLTIRINPSSDKATIETATDQYIDIHGNQA